MRIFTLLFFIVFMINAAVAQTPGCTDPQALNFDSNASISNGSCNYKAQSYDPPLIASLANTVREISGIIYFKGKILALNDGGNTNQLFMLDTISGAILQTITIETATNIDWEDLAQDSNYVYVADAGNNAHGNRQNLCIYKIDKAAFTNSGDFNIPGTAVEKINFNYPDQTDFTALSSNNTKFDCEAITILNGKLHLFTKNWIGNYSVHYSLPTTSGTYAATRLDSLNTGGILITGADAGASDELLLTGYSKTLSCAFFLIYGFDNPDLVFNTGNKRQIQLPSVLSTGQLESVCFVNGIHGFIASEYFSQSIFNVSNKLRSFTTHQWIIDYYKHNPLHFAEVGMLRFNTSLDHYEIFTGTAWEAMN